MSANNAQKRPFADALNRFTEQKALDQIQQTGRALPCSFVSWAAEGIALVKFEVQSDFTLQQIKAPIFGPEYARYPLQPGDAGILIPSAVPIAGISGQGGGIATMRTPANLSALTFLPIGNTAWQTVDHNVVTLYGPEGVTLRDAGSNSTFLLTPTSIAIATPDSFQVTVGATVLQLTPAGWSLTGATGNVEDGAHHTSPSIMNAAWAALVAWLNSHDHTNGNAGANTGAPVMPFTGGSIAP